MVTVFLGASFLIQAVLHALGFPYLVSRKYREHASRRQYQRGLALPYALLGTGWMVLGLSYRTFFEQNSLRFCLLLVLIAVIPFLLLLRNKKRFL